MSGGVMFSSKCSFTLMAFLAFHCFFIFSHLPPALRVVGERKERNSHKNMKFSMLFLRLLPTVLALLLLLLLLPSSIQFYTIERARKGWKT